MKDCFIFAILVFFGPREDQITKVPTGIIDKKKAVNTTFCKLQIC